MRRALTPRAIGAVAALALASGVSMASCSPASRATEAGAAAAGTPPDGSLREHARPIAIERDDFEDLLFLQPLLAGTRIVQLGENTHGAREYSLIKARLARFLHERLGYTVLAFESDLYQCYDAELEAAAASAAGTLTSCAFGVWHTREVLPLFEHLRASRSGPRPLHVAGMDIQPIGRNKGDRPEFLSRAVALVDAALAGPTRTLDSTFLAVYDRGSRNRRSFFRSDSGRAMAEEYDRLAATLRGALRAHSARGPRQDSLLVARQTAFSLATYVRQQAAPTNAAYVEWRDSAMAENLRFLAEELYPDEKIIVWGHNFHLRHANAEIPPDSAMFPPVRARSMGTWTRERYHDSVYTIGLYAYRGRAAGNSGEPYEITPAAEGSLEAMIATVDAPAVFIDLTRPPSGPSTAWMRDTIRARHHGTVPLSIVPRQQYDAVIVVREVTPRVMLFP